MSNGRLTDISGSYFEVESIASVGNPEQMTLQSLNTNVQVLNDRIGHIEDTLQQIVTLLGAGTNYYDSRTADSSKNNSVATDSNEKGTVSSGEGHDVSDAVEMKSSISKPKSKRWRDENVRRSVVFVNENMTSSSGRGGGDKEPMLGTLERPDSLPSQVCDGGTNLLSQYRDHSSSEV